MPQVKLWPLCSKNLLLHSKETEIASPMSDIAAWEILLTWLHVSFHSVLLLVFFFKIHMYFYLLQFVLVVIAVNF